MLVFYVLNKGYVSRNCLSNAFSKCSMELRSKEFGIRSKQWNSLQILKKHSCTTQCYLSEYIVLLKYATDSPILRRNVQVEGTQQSTFLAYGRTNYFLAELCQSHHIAFIVFLFSSNGIWCHRFSRITTHAYHIIHLIQLIACHQTSQSSSINNCSGVRIPIEDAFRRGLWLA